MGPKKDANGVAHRKAVAKKADSPPETEIIEAPKKQRSKDPQKEAEKNQDTQNDPKSASVLPPGKSVLLNLTNEV